MVTFNYTEEFYRQLKRLARRYHSLADDIDAMQHELMSNPEAGVSLGGGKRKYDKKEISNVSDKYIDEIIKNL